MKGETTLLEEQVVNMNADGQPMLEHMEIAYSSPELITTSIGSASTPSTTTVTAGTFHTPTTNGISDSKTPNNAISETLSKQTNLGFKTTNPDVAFNITTITDDLSAIDPSNVSTTSYADSSLDDTTFTTLAPLTPDSTANNSVSTSTAVASTCTATDSDSMVTSVTDISSIETTTTTSTPSPTLKLKSSPLNTSLTTSTPFCLNTDLEAGVNCVEAEIFDTEVVDTSLSAASGTSNLMLSPTSVDSDPPLLTSTPIISMIDDAAVNTAVELRVCVETDSRTIAKQSDGVDYSSSHFDAHHKVNTAFPKGASIAVESDMPAVGRGTAYAASSDGDLSDTDSVVDIDAMTSPGDTGGTSYLADMRSANTCITFTNTTAANSTPGSKHRPPLQLPICDKKCCIYCSKPLEKILIKFANSHPFIPLYTFTFRY